LQKQVNTIRLFSSTVIAIFTLSIAQGQTTSETKSTKAQKLKERKAQADSLLQKAGISSPDLGVGATVAGKSIKPSDAKDFFTEKLPDLGLKVKELRKQEKARRLKKKKYHTDYEGLPIVRMTTSTGSGDRITQIEFHVLKEYRQPRTYDGLEVFWYDSRNRIVSKSAIKDKESAQILHGPYKRYVSGNIVEEGNYYIGTKDGRWETYDADYRLLDKTKWKRGFPSESIVSYYDSAHTKVREVIPIQYGKRKGDYLMFYDGGQLMVKGQYDNDLPVGTWNEYYQYRRQRKKVTRYPRYWYEDGEGILLSEWDEKGKLIYERPKDATNDTTDETEK
jgi:antitoxin component YwqK of YwqJK toxin-antitoxin module